MPRFYVGLDLGSSHFQQLVMDLEGSVLLQRNVKTSEQQLQKAFSQLRRDFNGEIHVHMEAGELAAWAREIITPLVTRIVIGDSRRNAWIANDPCKGDRIDAFKLADLLRMNRVHEVYYEKDESRRIFKQIVQHYDDLTGQQAALKVKLKARLRVHGLIRRDSRVFAQSEREAILKQLPEGPQREVMTQLYQLLDATREQQRAALQTMREMTRQFPEIALFKKVPGVKLIGACHFSAYVQNPRRFSNLRKLWRYSRLGVAHRSSDGKPLHRPHLDKAGCGVLKDLSRKAFQASMRCRNDNAFKRAYREALERTHNATHARLSVQRKILAVLRTMWINNAPYRENLG